MYAGANQTEIKCMQICNSHCNISLHITKTIVSLFPKSGKIPKSKMVVNT